MKKTLSWQKIALAGAVGWLGYTVQKKYGCAIAFAFMGTGLIILTELDLQIDEKI